jgi:outer membrane protein OmpA-like peptidoglycan-associated protein
VITTTVTIVVDAAAVTPPVEQPAAISKDITFAGDSSLLTVSAKAALRKLVGYAKAHKIKNVSVTGYTLKTTAAKQSFRSNLGMARANAIAKYLKSLNGKLRVTVIGKGLVNKGRIASVKLRG